MDRKSETFTPEHVDLIYRMCLMAGRKYVPRIQKSKTMRRQYDHWEDRWMSLPDSAVNDWWTARQDAKA